MNFVLNNFETKSECYLFKKEIFILERNNFEIKFKCYLFKKEI